MIWNKQKVSFKTVNSLSLLGGKKRVKIGWNDGEEGRVTKNKNLSNPKEDTFPQQTDRDCKNMFLSKQWGFLSPHSILISDAPFLHPVKQDVKNKTWAESIIQTVQDWKQTSEFTCENLYAQTLKKFGCN